MTTAANSLSFLEALAARRRFGMKPGLDAISSVCSALSNPQFRIGGVIHIAGTNGKGATSAILDACLREAGHRVARYTSPHLVRLNERFFLDGAPLSDEALERSSLKVERAVERLSHSDPAIADLTFFEALTAVAFDAFAEAKVGWTILETGLGGRLDATNICRPALSVITRIGLDHCDWLGDTVEKIASEKAGIIKAGAPVVLGENIQSVRSVVELRAKELGSPLYYAPDLVSAADLPRSFSLGGSFNRENAMTALAAMKVLGAGDAAGFGKVVWPGRFQRVGEYLVDGAHNPPAATALVRALRDEWRVGMDGGAERMALVCGFCGDKDVGETLRILAPCCAKGYAVRTNNPRSLAPDALAEKMRASGLEATPCDSLGDALSAASAGASAKGSVPPRVLVCGSLFLAGEALVELGAYPWPSSRFDPSERLR